MKVEIPKAQSTITDGTDGLEIAIPAKRHIVAVAFLGFWLIGWAVGEVTAAGKVAVDVTQGRFPDPEHLFLIAWLGLWTVGGGIALYTLLWMTRGRERIKLNASVLSIKREVIGFGRTHEYDLQHISNLRVAPMSLKPFDPSAGMQFWGIGGGVIAFDYGAKTFRFGASIDEAEGRSIVERLRSRHRFSDIGAIV